MLAKLRKTVDGSMGIVLDLLLILSQIPAHVLIALATFVTTKIATSTSS